MTFHTTEIQAQSMYALINAIRLSFLPFAGDLGKKIKMAAS